MTMPEGGEEARSAVAFSSSKDSVLALDRTVRSGQRVTRLVTLYDEASERVRFCRPNPAEGDRYG